MRKRLIRGMVLGAAGLLVFSLGTANAAVSVDIDEQDGAVLHSVPGLPADLQYPDSINDDVSGTAGFDSTNGSVTYQFWTTEGNDVIVLYTGEASVSCNETGSACTWGFRVPFVLPPGEHNLTVTASEPNTQNPELPGPSATKTIAVTVL